MDDNRQQMIAQIKALKELQRRRADPASGNQGNTPNPGSGDDGMS